MTEERSVAAEHEELGRPLPESVRQRVIGLASDTLGGLGADDVPAPLKPFARFAPNRRAKLAATPLGSVLETDVVFRQLVASRLAEQAPDLVEALREGHPPPAADPIDVAAAAYLVRPPGWPKVVEEVAEDLERSASSASEGREAANLAKLRDQLAAARSGARQEREKLRADISTLKEENATLRQKLRQARDRVAAAEALAEKESGHAEQAREETAAAQSRADAELRRLRARLSEAEATAEALRRTAREGRDIASVRLRLLLDTVVDSAQGLRRELALPAISDVRPADTVDASAPGSGVHLAGSDNSVSLETLLALPQVHLIIDGYNVTKTAWPTLPLETQRTRLASALGGLAARTRAEVTVVFDGAKLDVPPPVNAPRGVRIRFSPPGVIADDVIRQLVEAEPAGRPVVVVSTDREVAETVRRGGARPVSSSALVRLLT